MRDGDIEQTPAAFTFTFHNHLWLRIELVFFAERPQLTSTSHVARVKRAGSESQE